MNEEEKNSRTLRRLLICMAGLSEDDLSGTPGDAAEGKEQAAPAAEALAVVRDPDYAQFHPALMTDAGLRSCLAGAEGTRVRENGLILCDDPERCAVLAKAGYPVAGYLHAGNGGAHFSGVPYVLSDIDNMDPDTYEKVFERLHHLPWTILTTKRCVVREMCIEDLDGLYALYDAQARRFLEGPGADRNRERDILGAYIDRVYGLYGYGYWAVTDAVTGELIGRMGFEPYQGEQQDVSFGYLVRRDRRRQGIALEAAGAILDYALRNLDFPGIIAKTAPENTASIHLLQELGFCRERTVTEQGQELLVYRYR